MGKVLEGIRNEMRADKPDEVKLRQLLRRVRAICEPDRGHYTKVL